MTRLRPIRSILATLVVGGMLGFLVPTFAAGLQTDAPQMVTNGETVAARRFIVALLSNDQATLQEVSIQPGAAIEAAKLGVTDASVTSLTFLGSSSGQGVHLHSYAAEFTNPDGKKVLRGFRVATVGPFALLYAPPEPAM
jgi:hypothetical protein